MSTSDRTERSPITRIIGRGHSPMSREELVRFRDLDRRQFLGQRPASDGFEMRERPGRHVAKHVQKGLRIESAPLAPSRSKARERIMSRFLKFKNRILDIESGVGFARETF